MAQYRKNKHGREFFSINGACVTRVLNKERLSKIEVCDNVIVMGDAIDPATTKPCTEEEFNSAYKEAFDRIALRKIV